MEFSETNAILRWPGLDCGSGQQGLWGPGDGVSGWDCEEWHVAAGNLAIMGGKVKAERRGKKTK